MTHTLSATVKCNLSVKTYQAHATAYYPADADTTAEKVLEGGMTDRRDFPLHSVEEFLSGKAPYVSVAMDTKAFPYGTAIRIPELESRYGKPMTFLVVDTGSAFAGKGTDRIDICYTSQKKGDGDVGDMLPCMLVLADVELVR